MTVPQITITHLSGSAGQPVVVVGPSLGTSVTRLWSRAAGLLPRHRVIGWDLPGHGLSAPAARPYSTEELAVAVLSAVDGEIGPAERVHYAGDSFGGAVGLQLVLEHPERFATDSILCSGAQIATPDVWRDRADLVRREGLRPVQEASRTRWFGSRTLSRPTDESRAVLDELMAVDATNYCYACEALETFDVRTRLPEVGIPFLAIAGSDDLVTTPEQHRDVARSIPGGMVEILPGVGHLAPLEDPASTAALLDTHFAEEHADES